MTFKSIKTFLLLSLTLNCSHYGIAAEKTALKIDDYFMLSSLNDPQISPDKKWVAYTKKTSNLDTDKSETRVWMSPITGGEAIPMTAKGYSASTPRWSPDNKYLTFIATRKQKDADPKDYTDKPQVWSLNRMGGEAQQVTRVLQGVSDYEWSPDGKRMLLMIRDPKPFELTEDKKDDKKARPYVVDRLQFKQDYVGYLDRFRTHLYVFTPGSDEAPRQITSGDFDDSQPVWSPDSKSIAFVSNRTEEPDANSDSNIWLVSADNADKGATLLQLTTNPREDHSPSWSPDGQSIAYVSVTAPMKVMWYATEHLATVSASGGSEMVLTTKLDRNVRRPVYSNDGQRIYFRLEDSGEQQVVSVNKSGKGLKRHIAGDLAVNKFAIQGDIIVALLSKRNVPAELYAYSANSLKAITSHNKALVDTRILAQTETIQYKSADGTEIEAFVTKPVGFNPSMKYPLILHPHGGPVSQYDFGFNYQAQLWAANGYVVIQPNPRGSSGYGQAFSHALFADWGNLDFQDVMAGVDYLIAQGFVDPEKLGVGGWSYGGILTNYVITQTTRFKAAVSGASETLMRTNYGHDHYQLWWETELGLPWDNAAAWERISPFNDVAKITTPTLWIGGAVDWNVPIINSEQMYQAMKRLGRDTLLVVYPDEHHGISRPSFQKDRFERFLGWFDQHIKAN